MDKGEWALNLQHVLVVTECTDGAHSSGSMNSEHAPTIQYGWRVCCEDTSIIAGTDEAKLSRRIDVECYP